MNEAGEQEERAEIGGNAYYTQHVGFAGDHRNTLGATTAHPPKEQAVTTWTERNPRSVHYITVEDGEWFDQTEAAVDTSP